MGKRKPHKQTENVTALEPKIVEHVSDDEDEEISEDGAFNSDDERLYGHLFRSANEDNETDSDEDSGGSEGSDGSESDGGHYMLGLLEKLGTSSQSEGATNPSHMEKLTLDNLMEGLNDTQGYNELRKSLARKEKATSAPIEKISSDREQRNLAYTAQIKNLSGWTKTIQENRQAETLDFKPKARIEATKDSLVTAFDHRSEFETSLQEAFDEAGEEDEDAILRQEERALQDDLGSNRLSMDEYKRRRSQLAQIRALMFYHEQKRHHMKKIKSKKYRRIRKKQRQRLQDSMLEAAMQEDESLANEMKQKEEISRIRERMTLAHKNTSKWAKRMLKRGKKVDLDTRKALSAQLKRGDDLRRKIIDNDEQSSSGETSDDEDLVKSTEDLLTDVKSKNLGQSEMHGLFKLSFMQRGIQKQRDMAKEEARKLLSELRSNAIDETEENSENTSTKVSGEETVASSQEMKEHLVEGELMAKSREFGVSDSLISNGTIEVIGDEEISLEKSSPTASSKSLVGNQLGHRSARAKDGSVCKSDERQADNPWMGSAEQNGSASKDFKVKFNRHAPKTRKREMVLNVDAVVSIIDDSKDTSKTSTEGKISQVSIVSLKQEDLVRRAFATTELKEVAAEFEQELEHTNDRKPRKEPKASSGWGSWTGMGAPPPRKRKGDDTRVSTKQHSGGRGKRSASGKQDVIINKKRPKKASDGFMLGELPHPFRSREEYEQVMVGGIGREWNVASVYRNMTRPEILTRSGKSIRPISKSSKVKRTAAKF